MPLYECSRNAENAIEVDPQLVASITIGPDQATRELVRLARTLSNIHRRPAIIALDGWYGVDWEATTEALKRAADSAGLTVEAISSTSLFVAPEQIASYKAPFITDDPGFGRVNAAGLLQDLMSSSAIQALKARLEDVRDKPSSEVPESGMPESEVPEINQDNGKVIVVYGPGAAICELEDLYDLRLYFDMTRQPLLWRMWDGKLTPFGATRPQSDYSWKEYYYCDHYLLERQKHHVLTTMDYWVEGVSFHQMKLVPREAYDTIMSTLVGYPVKEVKIFQPGPWGAYRYKDLWDVPGLECNAWNELAGPELGMLVDLGAGWSLNMPAMNLMQYAEDFIGTYINETYPGLFPMDVWLDDGFFPKPTPAERTSMPIHNHPSTDYVARHFGEPLGRYETYYIAEAYEGANTWMGYKDDADLEEWETACRRSEADMTEIPFKEYIANWPSAVGDLYLIPPGTTHGHGGNQMVLEMDTCPSIAGTEYSFFLYDFVRNSWDDGTKTMTARPVKMHLDHGFDTERWCRESWVKDHLLVRPEVVKWTPDYYMERYATDPRMPFHIERLVFKETAENDTEGRFAHIVTLTVGERVEIRSKAHPNRKTQIELFQSAIIPACFGEYEYRTLSQGAYKACTCTIVQMRWKKG